MGLTYASMGIFRTVAPLFGMLVATSLVTHSSSHFVPFCIPSLLLPVGAAYEGVQKRTFLAMSIMIATQIPLVLILGLLYHKLGRLRKQQMLVSDTKPQPSRTSGSEQDGASDKEDATEMSELLGLNKTP